MAKENKAKENKMALTSLQEAQLAHSEAVFAVAVVEEQARPYLEALDNSRKAAMEALFKVNELKKASAESAE